jgi:hypothetical protein
MTLYSSLQHDDEPMHATHTTTTWQPTIKEHQAPGSDVRHSTNKNKNDYLSVLPCNG